MDTSALALFLAVAQDGSFAAAARERNVDPSPVSRAIAGLEAELGVRLFQRSTRAMVLTDAGERFRDRVTPLIAEFERARDEAVSSTADPTGVLRLTASVSFGQTLIVPSFIAGATQSLVQRFLTARAQKGV